MHKYEAAWNEPNKNDWFNFFFPCMSFCCRCPVLGPMARPRDGLVAALI